MFSLCLFTGKPKNNLVIPLAVGLTILFLFLVTVLFLIFRRTKRWVVSLLAFYRKWPNKWNARGVYLILGILAFNRWRRLKERGVHSHNCNKLNETNMLSAKISREFNNSGISTPSIDTSRRSRDRFRSFKSQHRCQNPHTLLLCYHR